MLGEIDPAVEPSVGFTQKRLVQLVPVENQWLADDADDGAAEEGLTKERRYSIDPKDMLRSQKQAREKGLKIIGIYHSHPDHAAVPSECDRSQAWPEYAYIILSVQKAQAVDIRNWALDSEHQFKSEAMHVISASATASSATSRMPVSA